MAVDLEDAVARPDAGGVGGAVGVDAADTGGQLPGEGEPEPPGTLEDGDLWKRFISKNIYSTITKILFSL